MSPPTISTWSIVEIARGRLVSFPGDYLAFLEHRESNCSKTNAPTTRSSTRSWLKKKAGFARVSRLGAPATKGVCGRCSRCASSGRPGSPGKKARILIEGADPSGRKVIEARNIAHGLGRQSLFGNLTVRIMCGERIGLIGNNGVGKTTLLRILLGGITPQEGSVKLGTGIETGFFGQLREAFDPEKTIAQIVGDGSDFVRLKGRNVHVIGYLRGFLFSARRAITPVKALSGGERNRAILARLFTRPTNLLVLDEPTNDLDVETLEALEEQLIHYDGTLIIVSHDRMSMDNVVCARAANSPSPRTRPGATGRLPPARHRLGRNRLGHACRTRSNANSTHLPGVSRRWSRRSLRWKRRSQRWSSTPSPGTPHRRYSMRCAASSRNTSRRLLAGGELEDLRARLAGP